MKDYVFKNESFRKFDFALADKSAAVKFAPDGNPAEYFSADLLIGKGVVFVFSVMCGGQVGGFNAVVGVRRVAEKANVRIVAGNLPV